MKQAKRRTEIADAVLDEDGNMIKDDSNGRLDNDDGVIIMRNDADDEPGDEPEAQARVTRPDEPRPSGSDPFDDSNDTSGEPEAQPGNKKTTRKPSAKQKPAPAKKLAPKRKSPAKKAASRKPAASTAEPKPAGIKNKGQPKPRVRLGRSSEAGLFG
jgi:hypothetical protein